MFHDGKTLVTALWGYFYDLIFVIFGRDSQVDLTGGDREQFLSVRSNATAPIVFPEMRRWQETLVSGRVELSKHIFRSTALFWGGDFIMLNPLRHSECQSNLWNQCNSSGFKGQKLLVSQSKGLWTSSETKQGSWAKAKTNKKRHKADINWIKHSLSLSNAINHVMYMFRDNLWV